MTAQDSTLADGLSLRQLKQIDDVCEQLETDWGAGRPGILADYLARLDASVGSRVRRELLCQLVLLDLEYRWRAAGVEASPVVTAGPTVEAYVREFPELGEIPPSRYVELIVFEYQARQQWADHPPREEYLARFSQLSPQLETALHAAAAELTPTKVNVSRDKMLVLSTYLRSPLELGRQRSGEPEPYSRIEQGDKQRLVIAPRHEKRISRRHLYLEHAGTDEIRVVNQSAKNAVRINSSDRLAPGETRSVQRPTLIFLGDLVLRLEKYE